MGILAFQGPVPFKNSRIQFSDWLKDHCEYNTKLWGSGSAPPLASPVVGLHCPQSWLLAPK